MKTLVHCASVFSLLVLQAAHAETRAKLEPVSIESVTGARKGEDPSLKLKLRVASGGCTKAEHFRLEVTKAADGQHLRVVRLKRDFCETDAPNGTVVELTSKELSRFSPILVENPLFVGRE